MDISAYTSNIQPYGSTSGTNVALDSDDAAGKALATQASLQRVEEPSSAEKTKALEQLVQDRIELNKEQLTKMVEKMDEFVNSINKGLAFRVDEESGRDVVTIYEASTGDVIRQIPDEEMLTILRRLANASSNLFIEERV